MTHPADGRHSKCCVVQNYLIVLYETADKDSQNVMEVLVVKDSQIVSLEEYCIFKQKFSSVGATLMNDQVVEVSFRSLPADLSLYSDNTH